MKKINQLNRYAFLTSTLLHTTGDKLDFLAVEISERPEFLLFNIFQTKITTSIKGHFLKLLFSESIN